MLNLLTACKGDMKFSKTGWSKEEDLGYYPFRDKMLKDLTINYKIKGLSYRQIINLLGKPEDNMYNDSCSIYYNIIEDYGHDIDPVYVKTLEIKFDRDSLVKDFNIKVWKK